MKLSVSDEISGKFQNHSFMPKEYVSQGLYQTLRTTKMIKLVGKNIRLSTIKNHNCNRFNLLQVCPSAPSFVIVVFSSYIVIFMFHSIW